MSIVGEVICVLILFLLYLEARYIRKSFQERVKAETERSEEIATFWRTNKGLKS